jgi:hypothetical protein
MSQEDNHDEFVEIRARVDSIASAVFLISGGALSISIGLLLDLKKDGSFTECAISQIESSWSCLLTSLILFVLLKCHLVIQSFTLHWSQSFYDKHIVKSNSVGFIIGCFGVVSFIIGIIQLVNAAKLVLNA